MVHGQGKTPGARSQHGRRRAPLFPGSGWNDPPQKQRAILLARCNQVAGSVWGAPSRPRRPCLREPHELLDRPSLLQSRGDRPCYVRPPRVRREHSARIQAPLPCGAAQRWRNRCRFRSLQPLQEAALGLRNVLTQPASCVHFPVVGEKRLSRRSCKVNSLLRCCQIWGEGASGFNRLSQFHFVGVPAPPPHSISPRARVRGEGKSRQYERRAVLVRTKPEEAKSRFGFLDEQSQTDVGLLTERIVGDMAAGQEGIGSERARP
jgi:hypothetical protein